jgi:small conductance mechanosensitive channel
MQTLIDQATSWGLRVLGALVILVLGWLLAGWLRRMVRGGLRRTEIDATLITFATSLAFYTSMIVVGLAALQTGGVPITSLVAVLGAAGLAIGLAMRDTLANFASGIMLLAIQPFRVGHYVEVGGVGGTVAAVNVFTTVLDTPDNIQIVIPNSQVWGNTIKNYHANALRRVDLMVGVSYQDDLQRASEILHEVLAADSRVLAEPESVIAVHELADSSVNFVVRPWCATADYWSLYWDLTRRIKEELEAGGCSIPFPQRDLHLHPAPGLPPDERQVEAAVRGR